MPLRPLSDLAHSKGAGSPLAALPAAIRSTLAATIRCLQKVWMRLIELLFALASACEQIVPVTVLSTIVLSTFAQLKPLLKQANERYSPFICRCYEKILRPRYQRIAA
jgi:hypothetical protein